MNEGGGGGDEKVCPHCGGRFSGAALFCAYDGARLSSGPDTHVGQTILGQFRIDERIGAGGMAAVYRARQIGLDRDVAIKILHRKLIPNREAVLRFQREAKICASLDHPNLTRVLLFGELPDGSLYQVLEFIAGPSLAEVLVDRKPLPLHRALRITIQTCDAVAAAHKQGVVHRDIKPENIILMRDAAGEEKVKVLDFGIARYLWDEQPLTQAGMVYGTARYISPEGAAGEPVDPRSDVYSIGIVAYELLCGETPFDGDSPATLLNKHLHELAQPIRRRASGHHVPQPIADTILRALSKPPASRFADAGVFATALRQAALDSGIELDPSLLSRPRISISPSAPQFDGLDDEPIKLPGMSPRRRGIYLALGAFAIGLGGALVGSYSWQQTHSSRSIAKPKVRNTESRPMVPTAHQTAPSSSPSVSYSDAGAAAMATSKRPRSSRSPAPVITVLNPSRQNPSTWDQPMIQATPTPPLAEPSSPIDASASVAPPQPEPEPSPTTPSPPDDTQPPATTPPPPWTSPENGQVL